jgi:hypothetical protein
VQTQIQPSDEATEQSVHERSLIDHLVATFHSADDEPAPVSEPSKAVYDLIRTEWAPTFNYGTRG